MSFSFSMLLEDDLAEQLCRFKEQGDYDDKKLERILHYFKHPILLSREYLRRYYEPDILRCLLSANSDIDLSAPTPETLAEQTTYKIILSSDKNTFPYVNITQDKLENNFTATFSRQERRDKAKAHFRVLFKNAQSIFIYDNFLHKDETDVPKDEFLAFAKDVFPKKRLSIFYPEGKQTNKNKNKRGDPTFSDKTKSELEKICNQWKVKPNELPEINETFSNIHDRYIVVDRSPQIILTSGIDNLMRDNKDFTYILKDFRRAR